MKKLISLTLVAALLLAFGSAALAEEADPIDYANETGKYSLRYPGDWTRIDADMDRTTSLIQDNFKMDQKMLDVLIEQVRSLDTFVLIAPDGISNLVITYQTFGVSMSGETLVAMIPIVTQTLLNSFEDMQIVDEGSVVEGSESYAQMIATYTQNGIPLYMMMLMTCPVDTLYGICFTLDARDETALNDLAGVCDTILESFAIAE